MQLQYAVMKPCMTELVLCVLLCVFGQVERMMAQPQYLCYIYIVILRL